MSSRAVPRSTSDKRNKRRPLTNGHCKSPLEPLGCVHKLSRFLSSATSMDSSLLVAVVVRVTIALITCTFFQPDEYFQSLEVAHHLVFGYGHLTWEWLSPHPIRSIFYPALNAPIYWLLKVSGLDDTQLLIWGPKLLHGLFAAGTDIWLCELTANVIGERYVSSALFLSLTSFFHGLSLSRTMSNSLETTLTTMALSYFPWDPTVLLQRRDLQKMIVCLALACAVRPTNAVIWVYMLGVLLWRLRQYPGYMRTVLTDISIIGMIALLLFFMLDWTYYGIATFTPLNFLRTNLSSVSLFYGANSWHYYLSQGIPILCMTTIPFVLHGVWLAIHSEDLEVKTMLGLIAWTISVYSLAGHKEWRFLHPILPLMHVLAAKSLVDSYYAKVAARPSSSPRRHHLLCLPIRLSHLALLLLPIPALVYVALFHSRGQIDVMYYLRSLPSEDVHSIGFLMPCHSTPWQAYLHRPEWADEGKVWALGCEPPLAGEDVTVYKDQTDVFYESPSEYLKNHFPDQVNTTFPPSPFPRSRPGLRWSTSTHWQHEWPQYIVLFGALLRDEEVRETLEHRGYEGVWKSEHGWEGDRRRQGGVRVMRFRPAPERPASLVAQSLD
ncbi:hypothetical protein AcW1_006200 [Taiwanofungus camphoratus]|nr:hypothetical protein AcW2_004959 [Antrodia cinnamomea]KAI0957986.1 hypothetical protein AcW1_006200 [Antrodia cinnamomea]